MWPFGRKKAYGTDDWNEKGRKVAKINSAEIAAFHTGQKSQPDLHEDRRPHAQALAVLDKVVALNHAGRWPEARQSFDPAHVPFTPLMEDELNYGLSLAAILDGDRFLVRKGSAYQSPNCVLIDGEECNVLPDIHAFAVSRNRDYLCLISDNGDIEVRATLDSPALFKTRWPDQGFFCPAGLPETLRKMWDDRPTAPSIDSLSLSNDGKRVLVVDGDKGIFLLDFSGAEPEFRLVFPNLELQPDALEMYQDFAEDDNEIPLSPFLDMVHGTLSPCGTYIGYGTQDDGHYVAEIGPGLTPKPYAKLGFHSEYPHLAHFSDHSDWVAFNSCHFYSGATISAKLADIQGLSSEPYEEHAKTPVINSYLRGYAAVWLPASGDAPDGAFVIAGAGYANAVRPDGTSMWEMHFGSTAGGMDVAPDLNRMVIASHSGMFHIYDLSQKADPEFSENWNAPAEIKRWIFWDSVGDPIQW